MQFNRKKTRKFLFQKLYAMTYNQVEDEAFFDTFFEGVFKFSMDDDYLKEMIEIITEHQGFFVHIIMRYSPKFSIENMNLMYILPVFIGLAEIFYLKEEIPAKVSVNEAIEVSKVYGDDSAKKIVNGIMNKVLEEYDSLEKIKNDKFDNYEIITKKSL